MCGRLCGIERSAALLNEGANSMPTTDTTHLDATVATEDMTAAYDTFLSAYPAYASTSKLDELRATEYTRLDQQGHTYLDYTGGGLYADAQVRAHVAMLTGGVFGNPHSQNLTSLAMTERVEQGREYVLWRFNASRDDYIVIFTPNATGALKLIGDSFSSHSQTTRWERRHVGTLSPTEVTRKGGFHAARPESAERFRR
jgi:hypothetical protein